MKIKFVLIVILAGLVSFNALAKVLVVSDVDDTIKISHILNLEDAAGYATDTSSRFLGMSELFQAMALEDRDLRFIYLSNAPEFFMKETHTHFLNNGNFPKGDYVPRKSLSDKNHKINFLRQLLRTEKPDTFVLWGDNGERDIEIYDQFQKEASQEGVRVIQLIHKVYSEKTIKEKGKALKSGQVGFITAIDAALELNQNGFLSDYNLIELVRIMGPVLKKEIENGVYGELAFPYFLKCDKFQWPWQKNLKGLSEIKKVIQNHCDQTN